MIDLSGFRSFTQLAGLIASHASVAPYCITAALVVEPDIIYTFYVLHDGTRGWTKLPLGEVIS